MNDREDQLAVYIVVNIARRGMHSIELHAHAQYARTYLNDYLNRIAQLRARHSTLALALALAPRRPAAAPAPVHVLRYMYMYILQS